MFFNPPSLFSPTTTLSKVLHRIGITPQHSNISDHLSAIMRYGPWLIAHALILTVLFDLVLGSKINSSPGPGWWNRPTVLSQLSQWFGYLRVLGSPVPKSLVFWGSPMGYTENLFANLYDVLESTIRGLLPRHDQNDLGQNIFFFYHLIRIQNEQESTPLMVMAFLFLFFSLLNYTWLLDRALTTGKISIPLKTIKDYR